MPKRKSIPKAPKILPETPALVDSLPTWKDATFAQSIPDPTPEPIPADIPVSKASIQRLIPPKRMGFPRVREAREALKEKALELFELQVCIIREALSKGDFTAAADANQWLIEHMPKDDEGLSMIDQSIDKPKIESGKGGPVINIGFRMGGLGGSKELPPAEVIDIKPEGSD